MLLEAGWGRKKIRGVYWFVGGGAQWTAGPCLSTPDFVWTMNDRQRERKTEAEKKQRWGERKEREMDCARVCSGLKQGLTGWMMLQLVVTRSQFLHHT